MKIIELSKNYCKKYYNNDYKEMIKELDGVLFDNERIKKSFNFNKGTLEHLINYINENREYSKYYDLINKKYI